MSDAAAITADQEESASSGADLSADAFVREVYLSLKKK